MTMRRVKHIALDGTTVTLTMGRHEIACLSASYADKIETETLSHMGSQSIDERTSGAYKTEEAKIRMSATVFRSDLAPLFAQNGYGVEMIPIVIAYTHPDIGDDSDLLSEARFTGISAATEASAKALEVEFGIVFNQLYLTNRRVTINKLDPKQPLPASKF